MARPGKARFSDSVSSMEEVKLKSYKRAYIASFLCLALGAWSQSTRLMLVYVALFLWTMLELEKAIEAVEKP